MVARSVTQQLRYNIRHHCIASAAPGIVTVPVMQAAVVALQPGIKALSHLRPREVEGAHIQRNLALEERP